jgi:type IV secretory pathway VirJ component
VVGFNSLKYFWTKRTPEEAATAIASVIRNYLGAWHKQRVILIGYSFGADVLPFIVNRLPDDVRRRVATINLLGLSTEATFEFHVADWIPVNLSKGQPIEPELYKISDRPMLCLYGRSDKDDLCPRLSAKHITREQVEGGHHFGGDYTILADRILAFKERYQDTRTPSN